MRNQLHTKKVQKNGTINPEAQEVLKLIQPIFAEFSGVLPEEMDLTSDLEDDLSVDMLNELPKIVKTINHTFSIELDVKSIRSEVTTTEELIDLIIEEKALIS